MESSWEKLKFEADNAVGRGDFVTACSLWQQALQKLDSAEDKDPRLALTLDQFAEALCQLDKKPHAIPIRKHLVEIREQVLGRDHIEVANSLNSLAELYYSLGKFEQAQPLSERIMSIYEKIFGSEHLGLAMISTFLALIYHGQKNYDKAEGFYRKALAIKQKALGHNHNEVGLLMENYGALLYATGRSEEADSMLGNVGASGLWKLVAAQAGQNQQSSLKSTFTQHKQIKKQP